MPDLAAAHQGLVAERWRRDRSPAQELALLARALHREGYDDHQFGHITFHQPDGSILMNPWGIGWDEVRASDIVRLAPDWSVETDGAMVTPAVELHLEFHRQHPTVGVFLHHHPRYATYWAATSRLPPVYDQLGAIVPDEDIAVFDDYVGSVDGRAAARRNIEAIGLAKCALLAHHGVAVVGDDIEQVHFRAVVLEHRCRQAWHIEALGGAEPMPEVGRSVLIDRGRAEGFRLRNTWDYAVRRELRLGEDVLL